MGIMDRIAKWMVGRNGREETKTAPDKLVPKRLETEQDKAACTKGGDCLCGEHGKEEIKDFRELEQGEEK